MKALRYHARGDFRVDDVPEPTVSAGNVIVDVEWCGICGSDLHEFEGGPIQVPEHAPNPVTGAVLPVILGHEFAGTVSEVGPDVEGLHPGDRVVVEPLVRCFECEACLRGDYQLCERLVILGFHGIAGGFASRALVPAYTVHRLPDTVTTEVAALVEPLSVAWHAARKASFSEGETALVLGAGPIGLTTLACLRALGASTIFVGVRRPGERKTRAGLMGADAVFDSSEGDVADAVLAATSGRGVDVVFETSGSEEAVATAVRAVRVGGRIASVAVWQEPARLDFMAVMLKEIELIGSMCYSGDFPQVIAALADGRITGVEHLVTKRVALDSVVQEGFEALIANRSGHLKVLVHPETSPLPA